MKPTDFFNVVNGYATYIVSYLNDGWTQEFAIQAKTPGEAMLRVQNTLGSIVDVVFVERG